MPHLFKHPVSALNLSLTAILVVVLGAGAYVVIGGDSSPATTRATTTTAALTDVTSTVTASGTTAPASSADLAFDTNGTVTAIDVAIGDKVHKGQRLAVASSDTAALQLEAATSSYASTLDSYNADKADDKAQNPTTYAAVLQAKIAMAQAQSAVNGLYITAPIGGTVTAINGAVGDSTSGSSSASSSTQSSGGSSNSASTSGTSAAAFMTVANLSTYVVTGNFSETDVAKIKTGETASIAFNAIEAQTFSGTVKSIDLTSSTVNGVVSYGVRIAVPKPPANLRAGATATITITTANASNALAVPSSAVTTVNGVSTVQLIVNGKSRAQDVTIGVKGDTYTQIVKGLKEGDTVALGAVSTSSNSGGFPGGGFPGGNGGFRSGRTGAGAGIGTTLGGGR